MDKIFNFIKEHGFDVEMINNQCVVYIPWAHKSGATGVDMFAVDTMAKARKVLGY